MSSTNNCVFLELVRNSDAFMKIHTPVRGLRGILFEDGTSFKPSIFALLFVKDLVCS